MAQPCPGCCSIEVCPTPRPRGPAGGRPAWRCHPLAALVVQTGPRRPLLSLPSPAPLPRWCCTRGNTGVSFPGGREGCGAGERARLPHGRHGALPRCQRWFGGSSGRGALWAPAWVRGPEADIPPSARNRSWASGAAKDALVAWQLRNSPCGAEACN